MTRSRSWRNGDDPGVAIDPQSREVLTGLVERIDLDQLAAQVHRGIEEMPEYRGFVEEGASPTTAARRRSAGISRSSSAGRSVSSRRGPRSWSGCAS